MSSPFGAIGNVDPIRVLIVFGALFFADYALRASRRRASMESTQMDVPEMHHMEASRAPEPRNADEDGKAQTSV